MTHLDVALDQMSSDSRREMPCSSTVMRRAALSSSRADDAPPKLRSTPHLSCRPAPQAGTSFGSVAVKGQAKVAPHAHESGSSSKRTQAGS